MSLALGLEIQRIHNAETSNLSVVGNLQVNEWNGNKKKPQLFIKRYSVNGLAGYLTCVEFARSSRWLHTIPAVEDNISCFSPRNNRPSYNLLCIVTTFNYTVQVDSSYKKIISFCSIFRVRLQYMEEVIEK